MPRELAEAIDAYGARAGLSRIATVNILLAQALGTVAAPTRIEGITR